MRLDERQRVVAEIRGDGIGLDLEGMGLEGCLTIGVRRTLIGGGRLRVLPDLGALEVRPADDVGLAGRAEFLVPVWRGDAVWLDFTATAPATVPVRVSRDDGPETLCLVPHDPWIERCRRLDGSTRQLTAPPQGASRVDIRIGGSDVDGGETLSLHLVDAMLLAQAGLELPEHDPLERIDYAEHNLLWPFLD
ncbi:hypothetical protein [Williamsia deligens]|uniref:Uncharacterized protein n=1 Tax=Williamsia deligens TaxID=321325 RepID=A0ABW3GC37_9NOCA|nr:hypothetical protein [Williamsia deligens]